MQEIQHLTDILANAARAVGTEVTSIWFAIQLGLILLAAVVGAGAGALFRRRAPVGTSPPAGRPCRGGSCSRSPTISAPSFSCC